MGGGLPRQDGEASRLFLIPLVSQGFIIYQLPRNSSTVKRVELPVETLHVSPCFCNTALAFSVFH